MTDTVKVPCPRWESIYHLSFLDSSILFSLDIFQVHYSYVQHCIILAVLLVRSQEAFLKIQGQNLEYKCGKLSILAKLEKHEESLFSTHLLLVSKYMDRIHTENTSALRLPNLLAGTFSKTMGRYQSYILEQIIRWLQIIPENYFVSSTPKG